MFGQSLRFLPGPELLQSARAEYLMKHVFIISVHRRHQLMRQKHLMHNVFDASVVRVLDWNLESIGSDGFHEGNRFYSDPVQVPGRVT